jgi:cytochrome c553
MLLPIFISLLFSIGESSVQNNEESLRPASFSKNLTAIQSEEGLLLLKKNCFACHNPNTNSHDEIIAPPLQGIKEHYLKAYPLDVFQLVRRSGRFRRSSERPVSFWIKKIRRT